MPSATNSGDADKTCVCSASNEEFKCDFNICAKWMYDHGSKVGQACLYTAVVVATMRLKPRQTPPPPRHPGIINSLLGLQYNSPGGAYMHEVGPNVEVDTTIRNIHLTIEQIQ